MSEPRVPEQGKPTPAVWVVWLTIAITVVVALVFAGEFIGASLRGESAGKTAGLADDARRDAVEALLPSADPANAEALIVQYGCAACHRNASADIAPSYEQIAERAGDRVPGLSAFDYLYQSITQPAAFIVDGYTNAMPANYGARFTDQELADMIAYLMSESAQ